MKYLGPRAFSHEQAPRIGVLLTNLGTPQAPTPGALRRYLKQFLSDPRVVEIPRLLWWLILNGIILNIRPRRSAKLYESVWTEAGSPLLRFTQAQRDALADRFAGAVDVDFAMRYGQPSIGDVLDGMLERGVRRLLVLPLYPQYSGTTTGSTFDALSADLQRRRWLPDLRFVSHYHDDPGYIAACATQIRSFWEQHGRRGRLVLSYHGIPRRYLLNGDPYHCECHKTSRLIADALGLGPGEYLTTFQSRFGREEWLQPYTDETLQALPRDGIDAVQVFCPGFAVDCLETLEEIAEENRELFLEAGGAAFDYIPCLNAEVPHIDALEALIRRQLHGWPLATEAEEAGARRQAAAQAMGAER
jgi:ferrochelatase